jgi:outer membrane protein assembly factor BamB
MTRSAVVLLVAVLTSLIAINPANAQRAKKANGWAQFLGPHRNGISDEKNLIDAWPASGLKEVWRVKGGVGMSGIVVDGSIAVTMVQTPEQKVNALNPTTGKKLWKTEVAPNYRNAMGNGPRATPAIHDGSVYAFTGDGILASLSAKTGQLNWTANLVTRHNGRIAEYGMSSSPLIHGDNVIVTVGTSNATVVAVDQKTGKTVWTAGKGDAAGYSSVAVLKLGRKEQVVAFSGSALIGVDPKNGTQLWRFPYRTDYNCNIVTPQLVGSNVFISAGENHGSTMLALSTSGGATTAKAVWQSTGRTSVLRNEWQTSIYLDGHLFGYDNVGGAGPITHLTCLDAKTGEAKWQAPRFGKGNMIYADGKFFGTTMKGEVVVLAANPDKFVELGRSQVMGATRQAPALANGLLYIRDDREIICLDVRK